MLELKLLLLLISANSAPVIAAHLMTDRSSKAVDSGWRLSDGNPLYESIAIHH